MFSIGEIVAIEPCGIGYDQSGLIYIIYAE